MRQFVLWIAILWTAICWSIGLLFSLYLFLGWDINYHSSPYVELSRSLVFGLVSGGMGGLGIAVGLISIVSTQYWRSFLVVPIIWAIALVAGALVSLSWYDYTSPEILFATGAIAGVIGGLLMGLILKWFKPSLKGTQVLRVIIAWAICLPLSLTLFHDSVLLILTNIVGGLLTYILTTVVSGLLIATIGGGVTFWQLIANGK
ncbi:MAG: hypothetical protein KME06_16060 [Kastovskya adunca ATA6-11-RM4]|jgi:hypothetical protein|nr:hypothetical protein [Kastovskya adunca ATA6-11-RM4]